MSFAHLHVHTEFSLLDGSNKIKEYVSRVKELGMNSAAITDHGVMYGVIDFYREAKKQGINPILGCEVYVAPNSRFDREITGGDDRYYHLVLLAENEEGYANLTKIVSKGFVEGYYYKPRVDKELLRKYHKGIIALSACLAGEVARFLTKGLYEEAKKTALEYQEIFGEGNFFLELQDHGIPEQGLVNQQLFKMSEETGIELVATNDIHYTYAEDAKPHDILLCIQTGKKLSDENRMRYDGGQYYVKSEEEMLRLFPYAKQALENTQKIADRCHVEIEFGVTKLPKYDVPDGYTSGEEYRYKGSVLNEALNLVERNLDREALFNADQELLEKPEIVEKYGWAARVLDAYKADGVTGVDCYPVVSYTTEEIEERSPIYKDLSTYLQQAKAQFITGELDVDQDWDTYVNTVEQMNAGRLLEIEQAAYDRFAALKG